VFFTVVTRFFKNFFAKVFREKGPRFVTEVKTGSVFKQKIVNGVVVTVIVRVYNFGVKVVSSPTEGNRVVDVGH
jgi:hypothetical protein